jgi:hypothetical protein
MSNQRAALSAQLTLATRITNLRNKGNMFDVGAGLRDRTC